MLGPSHQLAQNRRSSSVARIKLLVRANRRLLFICAAIGLTFAILVGSRQTESYVSESTVQLQNLNLAATASEFASFDFSVENDMRLKIENAAELFEKEILLGRIADAVRAHPESARIYVRNPKLKNLLGVRRLAPISTLSRDELIGAIAGMITTRIDKDRNNIEITVRGPIALTTEIVSQQATKQFIEVTQIKTMERIEKTTKFFQEQLGESRRRLVDADEKLSEFTQKNPYVLNDVSRNEYIRLRERRNQIIDELAAEHKLMEYYREKIREIKSTVSLPLNAVRAQLQSEIQQIEYDRLKYLSEGYSPDHPGIVRLDDRIKRLQGVIASRIETDPASNAAVETDVNMRMKEMSEKILKIQDQIESSKIALKNIEARIKELGPTFDVLPEREAFFNRLKRDSDVASQLYLQLSSHVNLMNVRTASENGNWTVISEPSAPWGPVGVVPLANLIIFGVAIGVAAGFSFLLLREIIDPRLINRDDVESLGFLYAGRLSDSLSEQAEILATLGQIGSFEASEEKQAIVTVASPERDMGLAPIQYLTSYLANQGHPTLSILLGDIAVPPDYGVPVSIDFANIYRHPDGKRDLVQVSDRDTFVSLQNLISTSSNRYHAIYLMFRNPLTNTSYPLGLKMSNRLLLVGPSHVYTMEAYHELTRGFKFRKHIYFAFSLEAKEALKRRLMSERLRAAAATSASYKQKIMSGPKQSLDASDTDGADDTKKSA